MTPAKRSGASATKPTPTDLRDAVHKTALGFEPGAFPQSEVDKVANARVVMLGEYVHTPVEHQELLVEVAKELHASGTRWVLLEGFHAQSQPADEYVSGRTAKLPVVTRQYFGTVLDALRLFNGTLPIEEQIHVGFLDINHRPSALPAALAHREVNRPRHKAIASFLSDVGWAGESEAVANKAVEAAYEKAPETYLTALRELDAAVTSDPALADLQEALRVEFLSRDVREVWNKKGENKAHPLRESVIHSIVEGHLEKANKLLLNVGGFHCQRTHVMGTPKKWLAERLAANHGPESVYAVMVGFSRLAGKDGNVVFSQDGEAGVELFATLQEAANGKAAMLPVRSPAWRAQPFPVRYFTDTVEHAPGNVFDAYILLPDGHFP